MEEEESREVEVRALLKKVVELRLVGRKVIANNAQGRLSFGK